MTNYIQVITTTESKDDAQKIAEHILNKRLAGCVQILGPITSSYWWEGKIEQAEEWQCLIKSKANIYEQLEQAIREVHSYDVPEILATPIFSGSKSYLEWLDSEIGEH